MQTETAKNVSSPLVIFYEVAGRVRPHRFEPFPDQEKLVAAILAHERSLEYEFRHNWRRATHQPASPPPGLF